MSSDQTTTQDPEYKLEEQIGFLLRIASQRHGAIFQTYIDGKLTPTQFSTLIRLAEFGAVSQNRLGRLASMDIATIKGVVDRLKAKGLIQTEPDLVDKRRSVITLSPRGDEMIAELRLAGAKISQETLAPLSKKEQNTLLKLLNKIS